MSGLASRPKTTKCTRMCWRAVGRARGCRTGLAVGVAIRPAQRHEKSPAKEDHVEHGHHVRLQAEERLSRPSSKSFWGSYWNLIIK